VPHFPPPPAYKHAVSQFFPPHDFLPAMFFRGTSLPTIDFTCSDDFSFVGCSGGYCSYSFFCRGYCTSAGVGDHALLFAAYRDEHHTPCPSIRFFSPISDSGSLLCCHIPDPFCTCINFMIWLPSPASFALPPFPLSPPFAYVSSPSFQRVNLYLFFA